MFQRPLKFAPRQGVRIVCIAAASGLLIVVAVSAAVTWYIRRQDAALAAANLLNQLQTVQADADRPYPPPADLVYSLRSKDFRMGHRVSDIPEPVRIAFAKVVNEGELLIAEPGARWQVGCVGQPGLPRRRLKSVAACGSFCLVFYERGGFARTDDVAAFHLSRDAAEPVWHAYPGSGVVDPVGLLKLIESRNLVGDKLFF